MLYEKGDYSYATKNKKNNFTDIITSPNVDIINPPTIQKVNFVFGSQKYEIAVITISFELANIEVKRDEFFSLLIKKVIIKATQKPKDESKFIKRPEYVPINVFSPEK